VAAHGFDVSLFWPPLMGWLSTDLEGRELSRTVSRFNLSWCTGMTLSPYLCGWLSERNSALPFLAGAPLCLAAGVFVAGACAALPRLQVRRPDTPPAAPGGSGLRSTLLRFPAWIGLFASFFGVGVIASVFPLAARDVLGLTESRIGLLLLTRMVCNTVGFYLLGNMHFWHFRTWPMLSGQLLAVLVFLALAFTVRVSAVALLFMATGFLVALSYSESIFHGVSGARHRASRMGIHESLLGMGLMVGPVVGGLVYQQHGMRAMYLACAAVLLAGIAVQVPLCLLAHHGERQPADHADGRR
jgi:predicted MFS family arabinose efflux permease